MSKEIFKKWSIEKHTLHNMKLKNFYVNERDVWFVKMGQNIGFEENGKDNFLRPVLVLKKVGNMFFVVPLTRKGKEWHMFYHKFTDIYLENPRYAHSSYAILSQVKTIDKRRFFKYTGNVSGKEFVHIKQKLRELLL